MKVVSGQFTLGELREMGSRTFGDMVKAVVDVDRQLLAVDAELHSDLQALLIENGSLPQNLWGVRLYPYLDGEEFVEFRSKINLRPAQGNRSLVVESAETRERILRVLEKRIQR